MGRMDVQICMLEMGSWNSLVTDDGSMVGSHEVLQVIDSNIF
jgi:hypothetical protein